jgi:hypothetical protein
MLTRIFLWLFWAHQHRWKIHSEDVLKVADSKVVGQRYILQCEKCGDLKRMDVL